MKSQRLFILILINCFCFSAFSSPYGYYDCGNVAETRAVKNPYYGILSRSKRIEILKAKGCRVTRFPKLSCENASPGVRQHIAEWEQFLAEAPPPNVDTESWTINEDVYGACEESGAGRTSSIINW
jgi:hypothetical protein